MDSVWPSKNRNLSSCSAPPAFVLLALASVRLPSRDDADSRAASVAVTHDQRSEGTAQAEKNEAFFPFRMIGVRNEQRVLVKEDRLRLLKRDAVCPPVCRILPIVPFEPQFGHKPS